MPWNLSARLPHALEPICEVAPCQRSTYVERLKTMPWQAYLRGCPMPAVAPLCAEGCSTHAQMPSPPKNLRKVALCLPGTYVRGCRAPGHAVTRT